MLNIQVLGSGCNNCHTVQTRAEQAVRELGVEAKVSLVTDMAVMMQYGILNTPAIVINEKVVSSGRVPAASQIKTMLLAALEKSES